jgi:hypothetical protein
MMKSYERWHWRTMNVLRRVLGLVTALIGVVFSLWALALLLRSQSTLDIGAVPTTDVGPKLIILGGAAVVLGFGVLMLRARAYRPDLGDVSWLIEPQVTDAEYRRDRHWWTGDRKRSSMRAAV